MDQATTPAPTGLPPDFPVHLVDKSPLQFLEDFPAGQLLIGDQILDDELDRVSSGTTVTTGIKFDPTAKARPEHRLIRCRGAE
jgi:hypothetical protein